MGFWNALANPIYAPSPGPASVSSEPAGRWPSHPHLPRRCARPASRPRKTSGNAGHPRNSPAPQAAPGVNPKQDEDAKSHPSRSESPGPAQQQESSPHGASSPTAAHPNPSPASRDSRVAPGGSPDDCPAVREPDSPADPESWKRVVPEPDPPRAPPAGSQAVAPSSPPADPPAGSATFRPDLRQPALWTAIVPGPPHPSTRWRGVETAPVPAPAPAQAQGADARITPDEATDAPAQSVAPGARLSTNSDLLPVVQAPAFPPPCHGLSPAGSRPVS